MTRRGVRVNANANSAAKKGATIMVEHGARVKLCKQDGCKNQVQTGGVCIKHGVRKRSL
jgi:hypothetical protein